MRGTSRYRSSWKSLPHQKDRTTARLRQMGAQESATASSWASSVSTAPIIFSKSLRVISKPTPPEFPAPPSNTRVFSEPFPPVAYEGSRLVLSCSAARGSHLSYTWFFNRTELSSRSSFSQASRNKLIMEKVTPKHAGYYSCMAWSMVQNTRRFSSSTEVLLVIKGLCHQISHKILSIFLPSL